MGEGPPTALIREWSIGNTEKLICSLETTDWDVLTEGEHDVDKQSKTIIDYLSFWLDECVPAVKRVPHHDKPWVNRKIRRLLAARHSALSTGDKPLVKLLKPKLQSEIRISKHSHTKRIEESFDTSDRNSWKRLKSMLKLKCQERGCSLDPDVLNEFYTRFEREFTPPEVPPLSLMISHRLMSKT